MRRIALPVAAALALLASAPAAADQPLTGRGFATVRPDGWGVTTKTSKLGVSYALAHPGETQDAVGIPRTSPGAAVTIFSTTTATLDKSFHKRVPRSAGCLAAYAIGTPANATKRTTTSRLHASRLGGERAATITVKYRYKRRDIVQRDIVSRRGGRVIVVELDADQAAEADGQPVFRTVTGAW